MSSLSHAATPTFNRTIKRFTEIDEPQGDDALKAIADQALATYGASIVTVAGKSEVILNTQEQWYDGVVKYESNIAVVIKDGEAVWVGRGLEGSAEPASNIVPMPGPADTEVSRLSASTKDDNK